jgi:hypothetical protein
MGFIYKIFSPVGSFCMSQNSQNFKNIFVKMKKKLCFAIPQGKLTKNSQKGGFFMNKSVLILAILVLISLAFSDTIYLKDGKEIKNAVVTEIGVNDVKYKIGQKQVVYTTKKSDIAIIFYDDGTKEVFGSERNGDNTITGQNTQSMQNIQNTIIVGGNNPNQQQYEPKYKNFTTGQRWGTWALNALVLNGLGSWVVMGDVWGGFIHLGFGVAAVVSFLNSETETCSSSYYYSDCELEYDYTWFSIFYLSGAVWNIYRSASYDKPNDHALLDTRNFHLAVVPNKNGSSLKPALFYNVRF